MMRRGALTIGVVCWLAPEVAGATPPPEQEMVRPDSEGPMPPTRPTPMIAVTPPDLLPPVVPEQVWRAQRRKLKIQAGVAWTIAGLGLIGTAIPLVVLGTCGDTHSGSYERDCPERRPSQIAAPIFAALALAALIPAAIYTDRLMYQPRPERAPQLGVGPGGLVLRF